MVDGDSAVLDPRAARSVGRRAVLGGPQQRTVLALLLLNAGRAVSTDRIVGCLWADPPRAARGLVQGCVFNLRRALRTRDRRRCSRSTGRGPAADHAGRALTIHRATGYRLGRADARAVLDASRPG